MTNQRGSVFRDLQIGTTTDPVDFSAKGVSRGIFNLTTSAQSGTAPTLDVEIQWEDPASGSWVTLAAFTQVTAGSVPSEEAVYIGHPSDSIFLPAGKLRANFTVGGSATPTITASLGFEMV